MAKILLDTEDVLETTEAATELGIGYATLYRWIARGKIIPLRFSGRTVIPRCEVERIRKEQEVEKSEAA